MACVTRRVLNNRGKQRDSPGFGTFAPVGIERLVADGAGIHDLNVVRAQAGPLKLIDVGAAEIEAALRAAMGKKAVGIRQERGCDPADVIADLVAVRTRAWCDDC